MDLSTLVLRVEGEQGTKAIQKYDAAAQKADRSSRLLDEATGKLTKAFAALGGLAAASKLVQIADSYTLINGRLRLVTTGTEELARVQAQLFAVAQQTRQTFEGTADLYTRLARSAGVLGLSQDQLVQFTKQVGQALVVSGASAGSAAGALQQLGQALGGGVVRAEEFNSVLEGAPRIVQAVADSLGLTIGQLRALVNSGQLSSKQFADAFLRAADQINSEFGKLPTTVGQSLTLLNNALGKLVSSSNEAVGATGLLAGGIAGAAAVLTDYSDAVQALVVALGTAGLIRALTAASAGFTTMGATAAAAWALVTGPVGLTIAGIAAVTAGVYLLIRAFKEKTPAVDQAAAALARQKKAAEEAYGAARQLASATWVSPDLLSRLSDLTGQLDALRRGGRPLAEATKLAGEEWARSSGSAKSFGQALNEGDAKAQNYLRTAQAVVKVQGDIERTTNASAKAQRSATETADQLKQITVEWASAGDNARQQAAGYAQTLNALAMQGAKPASVAVEELIMAQNRAAGAAKAQAEAVRLGIADTVAYRAEVMTATQVEELRLKGIKLTADQLERLRQVNVELARAQQSQSAPASIPTDETRKWGDELEQVSRTANEIAQIFGNVGTQITRSVQLATNLVNAFRSAADAARKAEEATPGTPAATAAASASRGANLAAGSSFLTVSASIITTWVGSVRRASEEAERLAIALREQRLAAQNAAESFASQGGTTLQRELGSLTSSFNTVIRDLLAAGAPRVDRLGPRTARSVVPTADDVNAVIDRYEDLVAQAKRGAEIELQARELVAQGRTAEAEAIQQQFENEKELAEARRSSASAADLARIADVQRAEQQRRDAQRAEETRRSIFDLTNGARAFTDPRGASQAAFDEAQARRFNDAVSRGASAAELAAIKLFNVAEAADRAAQIIEADTRTRESLTARGFNALGNTRAGSDVAFAAQQRQEIADAVREGMSPSNLAMLRFVQFAEREQRAMQRAIEEGTQRIKDAAEKQIAAIDAQIAAEEARVAREVAAIDEQIQLIRDTSTVGAGQIDGQITALRDALEAQEAVIDAQLEALSAILDTQRAQLQTA
ncbi:MAG: tape measure protein, partial [Gemmatimonas sp.]